MEQSVEVAGGPSQLVHGRSALVAESQLAPAPPSAEEQGFRPVSYRVVAAGGAAGLASGESQVHAVSGAETWIHCARGTAPQRP